MFRFSVFSRDIFSHFFNIKIFRFKRNLLRKERKHRAQPGNQPVYPISTAYIGVLESQVARCFSSNILVILVIQELEHQTNKVENSEGFGAIKILFVAPTALQARACVLAGEWTEGQVCYRLAQCFGHIPWPLFTLASVPDTHTTHPWTLYAYFIRALFVSEVENSPRRKKFRFVILGVHSRVFESLWTSR